MNYSHLEVFCQEWLDTWSGNRLQQLLKFYAEDIFYADPAVRDGLHGIEQLSLYLEKLLAANPDWHWKAVELIPTEKGAILKWEASIPVGSKIIREYGLDIIEIRNGKICRNEVFFDRTNMLAARKKPMGQQ